MSFALYLYVSRYDAWLLQRVEQTLEAAEREKALALRILILLGEAEEDATAFLAIRVSSAAPVPSITSDKWAD